MPKIIPNRCINIEGIEKSLLLENKKNNSPKYFMESRLL
jgi:hypothetical protein